MLQQDVEAYVKGCNVCLASKAVCHKPYRDLQLLPVLTHQWKNLLIDFITGFPILANWKGDSYDSILVIIDQLTKIRHYKLVKITIDTLGLAEVIINVVVRHHGVPESILMNRGLLFTLKFWFSLYYILGINKKLFIAFHPQTDGQIKRQNSTM